jgi:type I restriction enzyme S subunit
LIPHLAIEAVTRSLRPEWRTDAFRRVAWERGVRNSELEQQSLSLSSTGRLYERNEETDRQYASEQSSRNAWVVHPGDLVVNPMWLLGGAIGVSDRRGAVSPDYRVYVLSSSLNPKYVHYLLRSNPYRDQYRLYMRAETTFDRRVTKDDFNDMPMVIPPLPLQRAIADILDAETALIDDIVSVRLRQVALLRSHFETYLDTRVRGLVEAYGAVPLKRLAETIEQGWSPECDAVPAESGEWGVLKTSAVSAGAFHGSENKRLPLDVPPDLRWIVRDGDLLVVRGSGSPAAVGQAAVAHTEGRMLLLCDLLYRVRLQGMTPAFAAFVLRSKYVRDQFEAAIRTDVGMTRKIRSEDLANVLVPAAPGLMQETLVERFISEETRVATARGACESQIDLLRERYQALVTVAVTGQVEIGIAA